MQAQPTESTEHGPFLLTIDETIREARTSRATLYREINSGRLKTVKLGTRRYTTPEFIREWIATLSDEGQAA